MALTAAAIGAFILVCSPAVATEAVYPVERAKQTFVAKIGSRISGFFHGAAASAENVRLRRELDALKMLKGDNERLEAENARLRRSLDYVARAQEAWLAAGVLARGGGAATVRELVRIDKGSLAGVKVGAVAAVPEGVVGRVTAVTPHTAEITLVTDPSVKVACEVVVRDGMNAFGIVGGGGEDLLTIRHLRGAAEVSPGSKVITSGRGGVFPPGLEVGTLLDIRRDTRGFASEGEVRPQVDFSTLEDVFIRREK